MWQIFTYDEDGHETPLLRPFNRLEYAEWLVVELGIESYKIKRVI